MIPTRWPCIVIAILCCLLTVTTSASAECGWVPGHPGHYYTPTHPSRGVRCIKEAPGFNRR